jgi:hypothetical protein
LDFGIDVGMRAGQENYISRKQRQKERQKRRRDLSDKIHHN